MPSYILATKAFSDLTSIFVFSTENFGTIRARQYREGLLKVFALLAEKPLLGRAAAGAAEGLRRHSFQRHVIFYTPEADRIVIERVIHMAALRNISLDTDLDT